MLKAEPPEEGVAAYRALLAADPNRPEDWFNLGWLLKRARQFGPALDAYAEALRRGVSGREEVHLNRAVILADALRRPEDAAAELMEALAIRPDYVSALLNLGNLHEDRGARDEAEAAYRKALALEPGNPLALMRVAEVTRFESASDPLLQQLRKFLSLPDLPPLARADICFALGRGLDQAGAFDDAFKAYTEGNRASSQIAGQAYDAHTQERLIDRIIATFDSGVPHAGEGPAPIFICGMFRSGSTMAERILGVHPKITAGGELELVPAMIAKALQPYPDVVKQLGESDYAGLRAAYLAGLAEMGLAAGGLTDKRPDNFLHIGLIKRLFPTAKIVNTRRNPLDNCLSIYFAHLDPRMTYAQGLESAAHWYRQYERLMDHWRSLYPGDIHDFDYDAMVAEPRSQIEGLLEFLDLPWDDACLNPHAGGGSVRTASAWQVREPLYTRSSGRWHNYERQLGPLLKEFGEN